jgi:hypothetical protein
VIDANIDYKMGGVVPPLLLGTGLLSPSTGAFAGRVSAGLWIANRLRPATDPLLLTAWPAGIPLAPP